MGSTSDNVPLAQEKNYLTSSANYTEKVNFRRDTDGELRREGWELFGPSGLDDSIGSNLPIRGLHQFTGSEGLPVLVAVIGNEVLRLTSGDQRFAIDYVKDYENLNPTEEYATRDGLDAPEDIDDEPDYFDNDSRNFNWEVIYTFDNHMDAKDEDGTYKDPFEGGAYRWEFVEIQNHLIINNGVDLPLVYKSEYDKAYPLYGLRENGVMSVGTISNFQDRLFCADLTMIHSGYEEWFKESVDPYGSIFQDPIFLNGRVQTQRFQYRIIYSAEGDPKLFNTGIESGESVIAESGGLPGTLKVEGDGSYIFEPSLNFAIDTQGSLYQQYLFGAHGGADHMGIFLDTLGAIKFDNEDFHYAFRDKAIKALAIKEPERFRSVEAGGGFTELEILLQQISMSSTDGIFFKINEGVIRFVNKDENNIVLLDPLTGTPLSEGEYSMVLRPYSEQQRRPAAFQEFVQDGSRIVKMAELSERLVVYRDTGFYFISASGGSALKPYTVDPRYTGGRTADFRHTVIQVTGNQHLFMGNTGVYMINRSSTEPKEVKTFELGPPFWQIVPPELSEFVYAVDNPVTREIFINCPLGYKKNTQGEHVDYYGIPIAKDEFGRFVEQPELEWGVIAYDYINNTLSQIDASFTACSMVRKPKWSRVGPDQMWFVMATHQTAEKDKLYVGTQWREDARYGGVLVRYGYGPPEREDTEPYRIYNRLGYGYTSKIKSGLINFGDSFSDKEIRSYVLELSSKYGVTPVRIRLSSTSAPQGSESIETMSVENGAEVDYVVLNEVRDENMIPLYMRNSYFRDEITVLPEYHTGDMYVDMGYAKVGQRKNSDFDYEESYYVWQEAAEIADNPIKLVGRTFEVSGVHTRSTTQAVNQG